MELPAAVEPYAAAVAEVLRTDLGDDLTGVYVHGSAALGGWVPGRSDVDVIALCARPLAPEVRRALGERLLSVPCPGAGLELSLVTAEAAGTRSVAPPFELHVDGRAKRLVDGQDSPGDSDLVAHFAVLRAAGRAIIGPPPNSVFAEPEREVLLNVIADDLRWGLGHGDTTYALLNACRALRMLLEGRVDSKLSAAGWARGRLVDDDLVDAAIAHQQGLASEGPDRARTADVVGRVRQRLGAAARRPGLSEDRGRMTEPGP